MATINEIAIQVNSNTAEINSIKSNSKGISELNAQLTLNPNSKIAVNGGEYITIQQIIDLLSTDTNVLTETSNYTASINDYVLADATISYFTITLPTAIGVSGLEINVTKADSTNNKVTINTSLSQTINNELTQELLLQHENLTLISDGANWIIK